MPSKIGEVSSMRVQSAARRFALASFEESPATRRNPTVHVYAHGVERHDDHAWELYQEGVPKTHIARRLGNHRETIHLWIGRIEREGLLPFPDRYQQAKKGPRPKRQVDPTVKRWVWAIREREAGCCGQKIAYFLEREHGMRLSVPKIYEILREKYVIRSKWKKNRRRGPVPVAGGPRQVVQMDTVMFGMFAFTAIDIHTREADILVAPALTAAYGCTFLEQAMTRRFDGWVELIQTDGGSEFKKSFARNVLTYCQRHRVARPYKKNEQAYIESFNRTVRKECLGWLHYRLEDLECQRNVDAFLQRYHYHRPHLSLGLQPPLKKEEPALSDFYGNIASP